MADEVYQTNVYQGKFHSFKKVLRNLQKETPKKYDHVELVSFHSVSKGMVGECGHRGGYFELVGFDEEVVAQIYKLVSISLCPPVIGQCLVELMVNPPKKGSDSYALYDKEYNGNHPSTPLRQTLVMLIFPSDQIFTRASSNALRRSTRHLARCAVFHAKTLSALCTSSQQSPSPGRQLKPPKRREGSLMSFTACVFLMLLVYALSRDPGSDRRREPGISGPLSWRPESSG